MGEFLQFWAHQAENIFFWLLMACFSTLNWRTSNGNPTFITSMKPLLGQACQLSALCVDFLKLVTRSRRWRVFSGQSHSFLVPVYMSGQNTSSYPGDETVYRSEEEVIPVGVWGTLAVLLKRFFVCSGTLSYIFNSFNGEKTFSQIVTEAKASGYTEPDPRDDLSGMDVARKVWLWGVRRTKVIFLCVKLGMHLYLFLV